LATPVQFICGYEFYKMAWYGFWSGNMGMDLLVAIGTTASYLYALHGVFTTTTTKSTDPTMMTTTHFFETSAILIVFVLAGKWMQAAAVRRTSDAITQLMSLQSPTAIRITPQQSSPPMKREDGTMLMTPTTKQFNPLYDPYMEEIVNVQDIVVGDMVKVIRGASIPVDGIVLFGDIAVDESMMTGESLPIVKMKGSIVLGGTVCVESSSRPASINTALTPMTNHTPNCTTSSVGAAFIQVTGVGSSSALAKIVDLVQQAQSRTVPIQSFADQVSAIFVPTVCVISLITYLVWYALCSSNVVPEMWYRDELGEDSITFSLMFAIACLVISCPCALGLATPTAIMVGTGVGAKCGILMKGGSALEVASKVNTVIFDKTGTLVRADIERFGEGNTYECNFS
jgi:Cu+-exporting ATPase